MIYQTSRDYLKGEVILHFDGDEPDASEILKYIEDNYSFSGDPKFEVNNIPYEYKGLQNPGSITVYLDF